MRELNHAIEEAAEFRQFVDRVTAPPTGSRAERRAAEREQKRITKRARKAAAKLQPTR